MKHLNRLEAFVLSCLFVATVTVLALANHGPTAKSRVEGSDSPRLVATTTSPTTTTTVPWRTVVLAEWTKVAICEEGGWIGYSGKNYPDSIGITANNWYANGGTSDVTPWAQIIVARRLVKTFASPNWVPDQNGCVGAW